MAVQGSFEEIKFRFVLGYKISACFDHQNGFGQDSFYVYVIDRITATSRFTDHIDIGTSQKPKFGKLKLTDDANQRDYSFDKVRLESSQVGVNRKFRYRLYEFCLYTEDPTDKQVKVKVTNNSEKKTQPGLLDNDYTISLGGDEEHLLGFRARLGAGYSNAVRFSKLRNNDNSFLEKFVAAHNQNASGSKWDDIDIKFSQKPIKVKQSNLELAHFDESFGYLSTIKPVSLAKLTAGGNAAAAQLDLDDYSAHELLNFENVSKESEGWLNQDPVETATFVFQPQIYRDLTIT